MKGLPLHTITSKIEIEGKEFEPLKELFIFALSGIIGEQLAREVNFSSYYNDDNQWGIRGAIDNTGYGFSLTWQENDRAFRLTYSEGNDLVLDQYSMFKKLEAWGFDLSI